MSGDLSYQLGLLLEVYYLGEEVCDLLLLSGGVITLPGQLFSQRGNLHVGITWKHQEVFISNENLPKKKKPALLPLKSEEVDRYNMDNNDMKYDSSQCHTHVAL